MDITSPDTTSFSNVREDILINIFLMTNPEYETVVLSI